MNRTTDTVPTQSIHDLLNRSKSGDTAAFRVIMEDYQSYAFAVAFRILCDEEDARDVVQEAFIRVWRHAEQYKPAVKFTTWLYSIVTNLCLDKLRARSRTPALQLEEASAAPIVENLPCKDDPETLYLNKELALLINRLTNALPPKQKIIFVLRDLEDLSIREVCEVLGLSESSVKTNLVYARRSIRQQLERYQS